MSMGSEIHGTVFEAFARTAQRHGELPFLDIVTDTARRYGIEAGATSYAQALRKIESLAPAYRAAGIGKAHRVALLLDNRPDFFWHWLALNSVGASAVPLNPDWREAEIDYALGHSEACLAVVLPSREKDFLVAAGRARQPLTVSLPEQLGQLARSAFTPASPTRPDGKTECALLYTSGTTGEPKGCILTNEYFIRAGTWYAELGGLCRMEPGGERLITPLPMYHMNAMA
ncbi:MAG: AMP-binding protein, partial [Steroidobacteraceae bacterium]